MGDATVTEGVGLPPVVDGAVVEALLQSLVKALRAFQIYLPNNPIYQRAHQNIRQAFEPVWAELPELVLIVSETDFLWENTVVYHQPSKHESLAWTLYKDGMRVLTFSPGAEEAEVVSLLETVQRARMLPAEADDDLNTLLWEQEYQYITYRVTEFLPEEALPAVSDAGGVAPAPPEVLQSAIQEDASQETSSSPDQRSGIVDIEDFDSTLYFLDEGEIAYITQMLEGEYGQDLRASTLNILLDLLELSQESAVRDEILGIFDTLLPNLLNAGEFRSVSMALREMRLVAERAQGLSPDHRERLQHFRFSLSDPAVLTQLLQAVDEATTAPSEEDLSELFGELRPEALETILVWLPRLRSEAVQGLLVTASERLAESYPTEVMRLLRSGESEALPAVIDLCGRLELQPSVAGLGEILAHDDAAIRVAAVQALIAIGSAGALAHLERALEDADREVRIAAVRAVGARGYRNALDRVESVVRGQANRDLDLTERLAFFEAYAEIAGAGGLPVLSGMLLPGGLFRRRHNAEVRACAALALGRVATPEAREVLEQAQGEKDLVVRNAVNRALREMKR